MRRVAGLVGLSLFFALGAVTEPAVAAPVTTTMAIANNLTATPTAVVAEARRVRSEAALATASPAARRYLTTAVRETRSTTVIKGRLPMGAMIYPSSGCFYAVQTDNHVNVYGWVLTSSTTRINNWCVSGGRIVSQPWYQTVENAHWGYVFCGLTNGFGGWFGPTEWGAGATFNYGVGACVVALRDAPVLFVYGSGAETGY